MTTLLDGKYVLDRRLGGGGMAEVYLARTVGKAGFQRPVAIKKILPHYSDQPRFVDMFVGEAQLTARLRHPNIVSVLDFDQDRDGSLFLVMELVDGTDLAGLLATGPLPFELIVFVISEVLRGLGYAHNLPIAEDGIRGLVHRDVSPQNVLLSWEGEVKDSDFGIAKARAATEASGSVLIKGKPAYMSPEQANGTPLDGTSDLFSVGVMLWEMLSGQPLFAADTLESTLARVMFAPIVRPSVVRRDIPADLEAVALRLLERDRRKRYPNAEAAIADLMGCKHAPRNGREALAALLVERFPGRAPHRIHSAVCTGPDAPTITPSSRMTRPGRPGNMLPGPTARRGRRRMLAGAAMLVVAAASVGTVLVVRGSPSRAAEHEPSKESAVPPNVAPAARPDPSASPAAPAATRTTPSASNEGLGSAEGAPSGTTKADAGQGTTDKTATATAPASSQHTSPQSPPSRDRIRPTTRRTRKKPTSGIEEIRLGN